MPGLSLACLRTSIRSDKALSVNRPPVGMVGGPGAGAVTPPGGVARAGAAVARVPGAPPRLARPPPAAIPVAATLGAITTRETNLVLHWTYPRPTHAV